MISLDNSTDVLNISRFIVGILILCYASFSDIKTRRVKNSVWIVLGATGAAILFVELLQRDINPDLKPIYILTIIPIIILFMYFLTCEWVIDFGSNKINWPWVILIVIGILTILYQFYTFWVDFWFNLLYLKLFSVIILIFVFYIFYLTGLLHGGADTKAMMAISILVPFYPKFDVYPIMETSFGITTAILELVFPYALIILFNAVIIAIFIPIGFAFYNISKGNIKFPHLFVGYKMALRSVPKKYVWLMERIENGKLYSVFRPSKVNNIDTVQELKTLHEHGIEEVWVTPQIPFMITLTIGFVFAFIIGNIMFSIVNLFI